jgi:hypothetical protein
MAKETTYAGMRGDWQNLGRTVSANPDLSYLETQRARLLDLFTQSGEILQKQASLIAAKQETSQELRNVMSEGQRLANVLRAAIKSHYGIRAEKLAEFGVQPFRGRRKGTPEPEEPQTAASSIG